MVRFSDLLGGNEDPEEKPAVPPSPDASLAEEEADEDKSPEDVLERLTQYATSSRGADDAPEPPEPPAPPAPSAGQESDPSSFSPVGDDLLPRPKGRKGR